MKQTTFLTLEQVLVIHEDQLERYGGSSGFRNLPLLESAIFRLQNSFGGEDLYASVFDKASALIHFLLKYHPFVDGNKRTASTAVLAFLELNGESLKVSQKALVEFAMSTENGSLSLGEIAKWLEKHFKKC